MIVECTGEAKFRLKESGEIFSVTPDQLDWDSEGVGERGMGTEVRHWSTVEFQSSITGKVYKVTWQLWEYPEGVEKLKKTEEDEALECFSDFRYCLVHEPEFDQDESIDDPGRAFRFGDRLDGGHKLGGEPGNEPHALQSLAKVRPEALAEQDLLGRGNIVDALCQLIAKREGTQHFSVGLFGSWGTGKSSLIEHLRKKLEVDQPDILFAEFNAWKNEKASNLGAMLAQSVVDRLTADLGPWQRLCLATKLMAKRQPSLGKAASSWKAKLAQLWSISFPWILVAMPPVLLVLAIVILLWWFWGDLDSIKAWLAGVIASVLAISVAYKSCASFLRENLTAWFKKVDAQKLLSQLKLPDYGQYRGLSGEIHQMLSCLCELTIGEEKQSGGKTLVLVIDDLDRCSVTAIKEVFDAVRLVADIHCVITLIAIDERMAFAAVEKFYDQFGHSGNPPAAVAREYLGKIFQASMTLPVIDDHFVENFVEKALFRNREEITKSVPTDEQEKAAQAVPTAKKVKVEHLAVSPHSDLPEEKHLFRELTLLYEFRNPRDMGRLYLSWRLLKALFLGERAYAFHEIENLMRLLFWREYRLRQEAPKRFELDDWLASGCTQAGPSQLVPALGILPGAMIGTFMGKSSEQMLKLTDAILLPASSSLPRK